MGYFTNLVSSLVYIQLKRGPQMCFKCLPCDLLRVNVGGAKKRCPTDACISIFEGVLRDSGLPLSGYEICLKDSGIGAKQKHACRVGRVVETDGS